MIKGRGLLRRRPVAPTTRDAQFEADLAWLRNNPAFLHSDTPIPPDADSADRNRQL